jgi:hypothetical protein
MLRSGSVMPHLGVGPIGNLSQLVPILASARAHPRITEAGVQNESSALDKKASIENTVLSQEHRSPTEELS